MKTLIQSTTRTCLAIAAIAMLAACGQKGPLYLPQNDSKPAAAEAPVAKAESPADNTDH